MEITTYLKKNYIIKDLYTGEYFKSTYWGSDEYTDNPISSYYFSDEISAINKLRDLSEWTVYHIVPIYKNETEIKEA